MIRPAGFGITGSGFKGRLHRAGRGSVADLIDRIGIGTSDCPICLNCGHVIHQSKVTRFQRLASHFSRSSEPPIFWPSMKTWGTTVPSVTARRVDSL